MKRTTQTFALTDFNTFKQQLLAWASGFSSCCFLDNNQYASDLHAVECLAAVGAYTIIQANAGAQALERLQRFVDGHSGEWLFGHLGYDLKQETEAVSSQHPSLIKFPDLTFFVPEIVVKLALEKVQIESLTLAPAVIWEQIIQTVLPGPFPLGKTVLQPLLNRQQYLNIVQQLQQHIRRGDCYEINFCLPFFANTTLNNPANVFEALCRQSPMPYACFYRQQQQYLLCASPERFLQKTGSTIVSQPMKGTAPRHTNETMDAAQPAALQNNPKERSENVMIADLVRNDLSKICEEGTVKAEQLFHIQKYPQVFQMISTISGIVKQGTSFSGIVHATFPMGSMTGAPKKRVMELIEQYEPARRGLFSGSVGYITPEGNFDFNVVIRSLLYNAETHYLQYFAGSAITHYSTPEQEYDEVLLKTKAVKQVLRSEQ